MDATDRMTDLREHVRAHAENRPGVYRMLGPGGEPLYVGKSIRVRTRLLSYFRAPRGQKAAEIVAHAHRVEWDYVPSEFASLLLELELIKRWRPTYNVEHKRDRELCFVKITREWAPRVLVAAQVTEDGGAYFGPFRGRRRAREAVRELNDLLELRDCPGPTRMQYSDQTDLFASLLGPLCLRADLGRCLAPCASRTSRREYLERVDMARRFMEGDAGRPLAILRDRMRVAVERLQFEYAADLRDRAERLEGMRQEMVALRGRVAGLTFVYEVPGHGGDDRLYVLRRGTIRAEITAPASPAERDAVDARIREIYARPEPDAASVKPRQAAEMLLLARWFRLRPQELERTQPPERWKPRGPSRDRLPPGRPLTTPAASRSPWPAAAPAPPAC